MEPCYPWYSTKTPLSNEYFRVNHYEDYIDDADNIFEFVNYARTVVLEYLKFECEKTIDIYIYKEPQNHSHRGCYPLNWDRISTDTTDIDHMMINLISPKNAYRHDNQYNDVWYKANLIHEYVHVVTLSYVSERGKNRDFMPKWFSEGIAEYIKLYQSSQEILNNYKDDIKNKFRSIVKFDVVFNQLSRNDLKPNRENYIGWAILIKYLIDTFSKEGIIDVFNSDRNYLEDAIIEKLGENYLENWRSWTHINQDN